MFFGGNSGFNAFHPEKFEDNDFTGFEIQPSVRLRWAQGERTSYWAAISRAVQTPVRAFTDIRLNRVAGPLPQPIPLPTGQVIDTFLAALVQDPGLESEELIAYEAGLRLAANRSAYLSVSAFYNVYDKLKTVVEGEPETFLWVKLAQIAKLIREYDATVPVIVMHSFATASVSRAHLADIDWAGIPPSMRFDFTQSIMPRILVGVGRSLRW